MKHGTPNFPEKDEYSPFYEKYINDYKDMSINDLFNLRRVTLIKANNRLPINDWDVIFEEGKWTIKQIFQHLTDVDRVFSYRALHIARKDPNPLFTFDENKYMQNCDVALRDTMSIRYETEHTFMSSNYLFNSFSKEELLRTDKIENQNISVRALAYITAGHSLYHLNKMLEKYI